MFKKYFFSFLNTQILLKIYYGTSITRNQLEAKKIRVDEKIDSMTFLLIYFTFKFNYCL